ncbi:MAG: hypothetical protein QXS37_06365, partial [Candidatus Aenigmatarchaeota archaeon]
VNTTNFAATGTLVLPTNSVACSAVNEGSGTDICSDLEEESHASEHVGAGLTNPSGDQLAVAFGENFLGWGNLTAYPSSCQCGAGYAVQVIGDSCTCVAITPGGQGVVGSGSLGYIAMWNSSQSINNSIIYQSGGNIGIGTTSPSSKLQVVGGAIMPEVGNSATAGIYWPANPGGGGGDEAFIRYYVESGENTKLLIGINNDADDDLSFYQAGAERMTIYNGNVGIGTTTPSEKLEVAGNVKITGSRIKSSAGYGIVQTDATDWLRINPDSNYPAIALYNPVAIGTGGLAIGEWSQQSSGVLKVTQSAYLATAGGNVGIGTTSPGEKLDVNGNIKLSSTSPYINLNGVAVKKVGSNIVISDVI